MKKILLPGICSLILLGSVRPPLSAAQIHEPKTAPAVQSSTSQFSGPSSVGGTLNSDRESEAAVPARVDLLHRYFGFKQQVEEDYGFNFGFDYNALLQYATQSLGEDTAAGGVFRAFGQWTLTGRGTENTGKLVYKVENRHSLGTDIAPQDLGFEVGYAGLTAVPFSDIGWALTNLFWNQHLLANLVGFVAGVALYGLFLSAGLMKNLTLYRVLMVAAVFLLGYGGVITHLINIGHMELYQSVWTWAGAIGINAFGLALNLAAAFGWFARTA